MASELQTSVPAHVCIIMDGNGRWAKKRFMPRTYGHRKGVETTRLAVEFFARAGVKHLTLFAFSSENWNRPEEEVNSLMDLFMQSLRQYTRELNEKQIRIRFIGDRSSFSADLQQQIAATEKETGDNRQMVLNIAANYGGRWDIVNACCRLAEQVKDGLIAVTDIDERRFASGLSLGDSPDPDLFIRTGGERRISNFLLWQLAYTECYFCDTLWPDFSEAEMSAALEDYSRRQRRFGKTGEQIEAPG
ncbi:MAG: di-trans,poly-cis-decaprenylcistransferase [Gammaproteobacteria bacterium]|nr:MAG: di-trans,poly-cis-decaprenylcistransferase [Gammaproteobacteria bacterium]